MESKKESFLFRVAKKSTFLQNMVIRIVSSINPSIEHNLAKVQIIKKAFFFSELENIEGDYFEFGVYTGTSLFAAVRMHKSLKSKHKRMFFGFDSFDDGFKYFDSRDKHPFFKEGDFKSSYSSVKKRFSKYSNVKLVKGYFENTIKGKTPKAVNSNKCAIAFIDCDLMNPALISLEYIRTSLQPGTVIIIDDYWAYLGNENRGPCGALNSFLKKYKNIRVRPFHTYGHGGMSFIVTSV